MPNENNAALFEEFWQMYPRRVGRFAARTAFDKALKKTTPEKLMAGCTKYALQCSTRATPENFIAHPTTWLNAGRWLDFDPKPATSKPIDSMIGVYLNFSEREPWDTYARRTGKSWPRDSKGGWWFPARLPPGWQQEA